MWGNKKSYYETIVLVIINRDVTGTKDSAHIEYRAYTDAGTSIYTMTAVSSSSYQYFKQNPNENDFSNAAVMNELNLHSLLPLNKKYAHLPNNVYTYYRELDQFGSIRSSNFSISDEFTFNSFGFVESRMGPELPLGKLNFIYNQ